MNVISAPEPQTDDKGLLIIDTHFVCDCSTAEHTLRFRLTRWDLDGQPSLDMDFFLSHYKSFWRRLWTAFRYVFKLGRLNSDFGSWILAPRDAERFLEMLREFKRQQRAYERACREAKA